MKKVYLSIFLSFYFSFCKAQWWPEENYGCEILPPSFVCFNFNYVDTVDLNDNVFFPKDTSNSYLNWTLGNSSKTYFDSSFGFVTEFDTSYKASNKYALNFQIPVAMFGTSYILFEHKFETDSSFDGGFIEFSCNKGQSWYSVNNINPYWLSPIPQMAFYYNYPDKEQLPTFITCINDSQPAYTGISDWQWSGFQLGWSLPTFKNNNVKLEPDTGCDQMFWNNDSLRFRFVFDSDSIENNKAGWMIRNLAYGVSDLGGGVKNTEISNANIHPNPANTSIKISEPLDNNNVILYGIVGNRFELSVKENEIDITQLPDGIYFIEYFKQHELKREKIIISH